MEIQELTNEVKIWRIDESFGKMIREPKEHILVVVQDSNIWFYKQATPRKSIIEMAQKLEEKQEEE